MCIRDRFRIMGEPVVEIQIPPEFVAPFSLSPRSSINEGKLVIGVDDDTFVALTPYIPREFVSCIYEKNGTCRENPYFNPDGDMRLGILQNLEEILRIYQRA